MTVQELILALQNYWTAQGCLLGQPYDMEKGAGTFNPATFLRALGPEPISVAYIEPCRRPADGRYGENPIRMQHYFQFQVIMKPNPDNFVDLYLGSLKAIGIDPLKHDLRFVHDDWETAALGAWGLGWEVWCDGTEITQFTYFQQVGGIDLSVISGEITYGLERLALFLQKKKSVFDLAYNESYTYGDIYKQNEVQFSRFNFELANIDMQRQLFGMYESECMRLCSSKCAGPALDFAMKASHSFNLLDARGALSVNERQSFVLRIRTLAKAIAESWMEERQNLGHPFLSKLPQTSATAPVAISDLPPLNTLNKNATLTEGLKEKEPLLIELGVEEMPAKVFEPLHAQLPQLWNKLFGSLGLEHQAFEFHTTPRRIVIYSPAVATRQQDSLLEIKGPPLTQAQDSQGNWTAVAKGWAQKNQITLDKIEIRKYGNADYLYTKKFLPGKSTLEMLTALIPQVFGQIHWYKTMRWGMGNQTPFVRPVAWLVALLGPQLIPAEFAGIKSNTYSRGHRFLAPDLLPVNAFEFFAQLKQAHVVVQHKERMNLIRNQILNLCAEKNWLWKPDEDLLDQVSHLVESPHLVMGSFDPEFLSLPEQALITEMKEHQRYFAVHNQDGKLHHHFLAVSNGSRTDMTDIVEGYETVLVSRLRDGRFFIEEDAKKTLESRREKLKELTFATGLGSVYDKSERLTLLCDWICKNLTIEAQLSQHIKDASRICKADLVTAMVGEFPELQGVMGSYYASREGIPRDTADLIKEHYLPRGERDSLPQTQGGALLALADRIDTLTGLFCIGKIPTGSADPFALRRACLGVLSLIIGHQININLQSLFSQSINTYKDLCTQPQEVLNQLLTFTQTRLRVLLHENKRPGVPGGIAKDTIEAVLSASQNWELVYQTSKRVQAIHHFRMAKQFGDLVATFRRLDRILETKQTNSFKPELLTTPEEKNLFLWLKENKSKLAELWKNESFTESLELLSGLRTVIDTLFTHVLINDPNQDIRANRVALLTEVHSLVLYIADFSKFQIAET